MHTRILMSASALFMGAIGLAASFLSHELLRYVGASVETQTVLLVQVLGATYLGFAFLNWYLRGFVIGGIYNRPLGLANSLHFAVVAVALIKVSLSAVSPALWVVSAVYTIFAAWFAIVLFSAAPLPRQDGD